MEEATRAVTCSARRLLPAGVAFHRGQWREALVLLALALRRAAFQPLMWNPCPLADPGRSRSTFGRLVSQCGVDSTPPGGSVLTGGLT